jgi:hypothetical protein
MTTCAPKGRMLIIAVSFAALPLKIAGQQPFLVDDAGITERHHLQLSLLNEYDTPQTALFPNQNQNTAREAGGDSSIQPKTERRYRWTGRVGCRTLWSSDRCLMGISRGSSHRRSQTYNTAAH